MLKGALHIHSTYSDGEFSLGELREIYLADGCAFACVTDHADHFDASRLAAYVEACRDLSDDRFLFIPGLEFPCLDRMHMIGYGVTQLVDTIEPAGVMAHIDACGGVSVIAHPRDAHFDWIGGFGELPHGLEVWNTKYDGRYAPRPGTFALLRLLHTRRPEMRAFYGQDLHWRKQYRGLTVRVEAAAATRDAVLDALRSGRFHGEKDGLRLPSDGALPDAVLSGMERAHRRSSTLRAILRGVKGAADLLGVPVPARLKAHARSIM